MAATFDITSYPGNIINNTFVSTATTRHSINPSTNSPLYEVPVASREDLDAAVKHAQQAFKSWSKTTSDSRRALVLQLADAIEQNREALEKLLTMEQGKPIGLAQTELDYTLRWLRGLADLKLDEEILDEDDEKTVYQSYPPVGVCGAIVPWNWPVFLGTAKVAAALLTGNVLIMKPSPYTPYCNLKIGELAMSVFPPGVFQVLSGDDDLGPWMTEHPHIDLISFTGSIPTGKRVAASCTKTLKRYTLELGGNDAAIVCEDVDIAKCMPKLTALAFLNSGQICMLPKRIYIHEKIYDQFRDAMVEFAKGHIKTGDGFTPDIHVGPVQNKMQFDVVRDLVQDVDKCGLKTALKGSVQEDPTKGYFIEPTIVDNPAEDSRIVVEEPFGPIVPILKWSSEEDVIERANALRTALGASVWSKDVKRAERMARELSAGSVWVNSHMDIAPNVPFGGHKESGIGMEWGVVGLKNFTNTRSLWVWKKVFE